MTTAPKLTPNGFRGLGFKGAGFRVSGIRV